LLLLDVILPVLQLVEVLGLSQGQPRVSSPPRRLAILELLSLVDTLGPVPLSHIGLVNLKRCLLNLRHALLGLWVALDAKRVGHFRLLRSHIIVSSYIII